MSVPPERWRTVAEFFVPGIPRPGGSKTATLIRRRGGEIVMKNGRPLITTRDDAKGNAEWKQTVSYFARQAFEGDPLTGYLSVEMHFVLPRPAGHFGTGRNAGQVRASAPPYPGVKPDALKMARSTEDALTGIVWRDDCLIVRGRQVKTYGVRPGAMICVRELEVRHGQ